MCWRSAIERVAGGAVDMAKDAVPAAAVVGTATVSGSVLNAPTWMIGLGQAIIVVYFTLRGVDRRQRQRDARLEELSGRVESLHGRIDGLACATPRRRSTDVPRLTPCPTDGSE